MLNKGVFTTIDVPGAIDSRARTGNYHQRNQRVRPVHWNLLDRDRHYAFTPLSGRRAILPRSTRAARTDRKAASSTRKARSWEVTGMQDQKRHGFIWRKGVFTPFNVPGDHPTCGTVAFGINDIGQVVGTYVDDDLVTTEHRHGFLRSRKATYTTLDVPGAAFTVAQGINNAGQIVGFTRCTTFHGFVLSKGVFTTIDVPGSTETEILSINAKGEIVGFYVDAEDKQHGFVGTPVR